MMKDIFIFCLMMSLSIVVCGQSKRVANTSNSSGNKGIFSVENEKDTARIDTVNLTGNLVFKGPINGSKSYIGSNGDLFINRWNDASQNYGQYLGTDHQFFHDRQSNLSTSVIEFFRRGWNGSEYDITPNGAKMGSIWFTRATGVGTQDRSWMEFNATITDNATGEGYFNWDIEDGDVNKNGELFRLTNQTAAPSPYRFNRMGTGVFGAGTETVRMAGTDSDGYLINNPLFYSFNNTTSSGGVLMNTTGTGPGSFFIANKSGIVPLSPEDIGAFTFGFNGASIGGMYGKVANFSGSSQLTFVTGPNTSTDIAMLLDEDQNVALPGYASGAKDDTPTKALGLNGSNEVVTFAVPSGGSDGSIYADSDSLQNAETTYVKFNPDEQGLTFGKINDTYYTYAPDEMGLAIDNYNTGSVTMFNGNGSDVLNYTGVGTTNFEAYVGSNTTGLSSRITAFNPNSETRGIELFTGTASTWSNIGIFKDGVTASTRRLGFGVLKATETDISGYNGIVPRASDVNSDLMNFVVQKQSTTSGNPRKNVFRIAADTSAVDGDTIWMYDKFFFPDVTPTNNGNPQYLSWTDGVPGFGEVAGGGSDGNGIYTGTDSLLSDPITHVKMSSFEQTLNIGEFPDTYFSYNSSMDKGLFIDNYWNGAIGFANSDGTDERGYMYLGKDGEYYYVTEANSSPVENFMYVPKPTQDAALRYDIENGGNGNEKAQLRMHSDVVDMGLSDLTSSNGIYFGVVKNAQKGVLDALTLEDPGKYSFAVQKEVGDSYAALFDIVADSSNIEGTDVINFFGKYGFPDATPIEDGSDQMLVWNNGVGSFAAAGGGSDGNGLFDVANDGDTISSGFTAYQEGLFQLMSASGNKQSRLLLSNNTAINTTLEDRNIDATVTTKLTLSHDSQSSMDVAPGTGFLFDVPQSNYNIDADTLKLLDLPNQPWVRDDFYVLTSDASGHVQPSIKGLYSDTTIFVTNNDILSITTFPDHEVFTIHSTVTSGSSSDNDIILPTLTADMVNRKFVVINDDTDTDATSGDNDTAVASGSAIISNGKAVSGYIMAAGEVATFLVVNDNGTFQYHLTSSVAATNVRQTITAASQTIQLERGMVILLDAATQGTTTNTLATSDLEDGDMIQILIFGADTGTSTLDLDVGSIVWDTLAGSGTEAFSGARHSFTGTWDDTNSLLILNGN